MNGVNMKSTILFLLISTFLFPNDKGFIYGKITMRDGKVYQGVIRWGEGYGKEHFWADSFNSSKIENEYEDVVDPRDFRKKRSRHFFGIFTRSSRDYLATHQFVCYFGDIKKVMPLSNSRAEITLKNDVQYEVSGSDAGETIYIIDEKDGDEIKIKWRKIDIIEFMETPEELNYNFGMALHGTVVTEIGSFKGLIQWDYDESLANDELNGDERDYDFSEIKTIEKSSRSRVNVILTNGRELSLSGTNDVDDDNRGIVVKTDNIGTLVIKWREFESVTFDHDKSSGPAYNEFSAAKKIYATVELENNEKIKGRIAFDLDETYDIEMIEGEDENIEFNIPIRNINSLENLNRDASKLTLKSGMQIKLYDSRDVGEDNDGLLVWTANSEEPRYLRWSDVYKITFEN